MRAALLLLLLGGCLLGITCGGSSSGNLSAPPTTCVNPPKQRLFTTLSSGMEPTLHCARGPAFPGCLGKADDRVLVFRTPPEAAVKCGEGGVFVKRVIGLPGDTVHEDANGFIDIDGKRLAEPYLSAPRRLADSQHFGETWHVPQGEYFMLETIERSPATLVFGARCLLTT